MNPIIINEIELQYWMKVVSENPHEKNFPQKYQTDFIFLFITFLMDILSFGSISIMRRVVLVTCINAICII